MKSFTRLNVHDKDWDEESIDKPLPSIPNHSSAKNFFHRHYHPGDWFSIFLRSLGLQTLNVRRQFSNSEPLKVAIHKSRFKALIRSSIHTIPASVSIFLIQLNWRSKYFLHDSPWYSALPYAAKLHEVFMQMSIAAILATWVRRELMQSSGIPFGGLVALFQATNPAYIMSSEFWSTVFPARVLGRRSLKPLMFGLVIVFTVALASVVGPSSTIAMQPKEGVFVFKNSTITYEIPENELFPSLLDAQDTRVYFNYTDPAAYTMNSPFYPRDLEAIGRISDIITGRHATDGECVASLGGHEYLRELRVWIASPIQDPSMDTGRFLNYAEIPPPERHTRKKIPGSTAVATTQSQLVLSKWASDVSSFDHSDEKARHPGTTLNYTYGPAVIPYATTQCYTTNWQEQNGYENGPTWIDMPRSGRLPFFQFDPAFKVMFPDFNNGDLVWNTTLQDLRNKILESSANEFFEWYAPPESYQGQISLLTVLHIAGRFSACSIKASWGTSLLNSAWTLTAGQEKDEAAKRPKVESPPFDAAWKNHTTWPNEIISITPNFMENAYPALLEREMEQNTPRKDYYEEIPLGLLYSEWPEPIISGLVATAMSRLHSNTDLKATFNATGQISNGYTIAATKSYMGRGWLVSDLTGKLAIAVLGIYCMIVLLHVCYTFGTGVSSNNWDTVGELTALAMNSKPSSLLENCSAGISTRKTFSEPVGIRVRDLHRLELVFMSEEIGQQLSKVEPNKKY